MQSFVLRRIRLEDAFIFLNDGLIIKRELNKHGIQKPTCIHSRQSKKKGSIAYVEDHEVVITEPDRFQYGTGKRWPRPTHPL